MEYKNKSIDTILKYLLISVLIGIIIYFGRPFFVPLSYGLFIAIVLYPTCLSLEKKKWPRSLAIIASLFIVFLLFTGLILILLAQANYLVKEIPMLQKQIIPTLDSLQLHIENKFGIPIIDQISWLKNGLFSLSNNAGNYLNNLINITFNVLIYLFIIPLYSALFLYYRGTFVRFIHSIVSTSKQSQLNEILISTIHIYARYIRGMVLIYLIVGTLNTLGLFLLGVENALAYGMLTAVMTIIPYFGIIISAMLPITFSWTSTGSIVQPTGIILVFAFVQYLEANFIFPYVAGRHLDLNLWASIAAIFLGAIFWGVSGMILFLPFVAVLNIIAGQVEELKPIHILLSR